jgi:hypothetical protein
MEGSNIDKNTMNSPRKIITKPVSQVLLELCGKRSFHSPTQIRK